MPPRRFELVPEVAPDVTIHKKMNEQVRRRTRI